MTQVEETSFVVRGITAIIVFYFNDFIVYANACDGGVLCFDYSYTFS